MTSKKLLGHVLSHYCEFKGLIPNYGKIFHIMVDILCVSISLNIGFQQLKESFARVQACISELRSLPREGCFPQGGDGVVQAVQDGLQQFKQYSRHTVVGGSTNSSVEVRKHWEDGRSHLSDL